MASKQRLALGRLLAAALVDILVLYLVMLAWEGALWAMERRLPLNDAAHTWGKAIHNNRGFRGRDFAIPKPKGTYRIMTLGDSLTYGVGLAQEERYTELMERLLRADVPGARVEVLNFGVPGYSTLHELELLKSLFGLVDPDLVLIGFCFNDPFPREQEDSAERDRFGPLLNGLKALRRAGLRRVGALLSRRCAILLEAAGLVPRWQVSLQRAYEKDSPWWRSFTAALRAVKRISDRGGLPPPVFAILNQGTSRTGPTDYGRPDEELRAMLRWYRQAEAAAEEAGLVTVDFDEEFRAELAREPLAVNPWDGHPSARCNQVYARKLARLIAPLVRARRRR